MLSRYRTGDTNLVSYLLRSQYLLTLIGINLEVMTQYLHWAKFTFLSVGRMESRPKRNVEGLDYFLELTKIPLAVMGENSLEYVFRTVILFLT